MEGDRYMFILISPRVKIVDIHLGVPGLVNVENGVAAAAIAYLLDADTEKIKAGISSFEGIKRRFDFRINSEKLVYIDDYAHHPEELRFAIESVRKLYAGRHVTGVFQPHLFTRTRDFADEFAQSLSMLDSLILLDIYPAREEPIEGVTSEIIFNNVTINDKILCAKEDVVNILKDRNIEILITLGAGNIDTIVENVENFFKNII